MTVALPFGWIERPDNDESLMATYQKTYPDGLDVLLTIEYRNKMYELWSSAEHRCSGPERHMDSVHPTLETAQKAALNEMVGWDSE